MLMDEIGRWARLLAGSPREQADQPLRICRLCVDTLGVTGAGIAMVTSSGNRGVVCATDDISAQVEDLQLTLGEGPCVDAVQRGAPVVVPDLGAPAGLAVDRWPAFIEGATSAGVKAVFAFPLRVGAISVGAMDLYRDRPGDLSSSELRGALLAADAAALAVLHLETDGDEAFADVPDARSTYQLQVHQATGMAMGQLDVSVEQAFLLLRARAFSEGRALAELATDVVARRVRFSPEDT
jgi:hypothetical protein